jgi:hypothetical protein
MDKPAPVRGDCTNTMRKPTPMHRHLTASFSALLALALPATGQDWPNSGGNPQRNGLAAAYGPLTAQLRWSGAPTSIISWQPIVAAGSVFVVRQTGFLPASAPNDAPVFAFDLATGAQQWRRDLPYNTGDWTTWLLGHSQGQVYASRAGNGASVSAQVHALDAATGAILWTSQASIDAGAYDGVVFADNGDLIVASFRNIWRIRATDGATLWVANRFASVSGNCGAARFGDAVYVADAAVGGNVLKRYDLATGAFLYQSPVMSGFLSQHTPMVGPDGTVYYNRAQSNTAVDFFYAFTDTGSAFVQRWAVPSLPGAGAEYGCGPDGSVYMVQPGEILTRLDPQTGVVLDTYPQALGYTTTRFSIDADGRVYASNGGFATGRVFAFDADLTLRWSVPVANVNIGGPCLAADGTLVVSGVGTNLFAWRTPSPWTALGGGIAGGGGLPLLTGHGSLTAGNVVRFDVQNAPPNAFGVFVFGLAAGNLPVFGGTLVPRPDASLPALVDGTGRWSLNLPWAAGWPIGSSIYWQFGVLDPGALSGIAASDGLRSITP